MRRLAVPMVILLIASHSAFAQERSIAGRVVDADGRAVANASVATSWRANGPLKKPDGTAFDLKEPTQLHEFWGNVGDMAPVESVETTDDGMFAISIQPFDRALFAIDHDRTLGCIVEIPRENEAGQPLILRLVPLVTVVAEFRTSVESVSVDWFHAYVELPLDAQNPLGSRRLVSCGSFDRRFEVKLPPGAYRLDAHATSDSAVGSSELSVTPSPAVIVRATDTKIDIGMLDLTLGKPGLDDLVRESKQSDRWRDYRDHVGQPAPAWHAVDGRRIDHTANLDAMRGKWVLLYFWNLRWTPVFGRLDKVEFRGWESLAVFHGAPREVKTSGSRAAAIVPFSFTMPVSLTKALFRCLRVHWTTESNSFHAQPEVRHGSCSLSDTLRRASRKCTTRCRGTVSQAAPALS